MFMMVDNAWKMTVKFFKFGEYELFEHFALFVLKVNTTCMQNWALQHSSC